MLVSLMMRPPMDGYELGLNQFLKNETYLRGLWARRWTFGFHEVGKNLGQLSKCSAPQDISYTTEFYLFYGASARSQTTDLPTYEYYLFTALLNLLSRATTNVSFYHYLSTNKLGLFSIAGDYSLCLTTTCWGTPIIREGLSYGT
jgi:hypothetical protein